MISERDFAAEFQGFWNDVLPLLTPAYVRVFNEAYATPVKDDLGQPIEPIPIGSAVRHHDVVAELAFNLARLAREHGCSVRAIMQNDETRVAALNESLHLLRQYEHRQAAEPQTSQDEWQEAERLADTYEVFLQSFGHKVSVQFSPLIPGAGFLPSCHADLSVDQVLFEVKTVNRNIAGKDIRQLIVYLALQAASGDRRWASGGFFNPRRSLWYQFSVDHLIYRTSGGRATSDVFAEIIDFLASREVDLGIAF